VSYPGHVVEDVPLVRLAKHVLSICANSASCERLFSIFGNTLTKLRNRLGTTTLTHLAELKMLIRDQHVQSGSVPTRLKRKFGALSEQLSPSPQPDLPTTAETETTDVETEPSQDLDEIDETDETIDANDEFTSLAAQMEQMVDDDEDPSDTPPSTTTITVTIKELFNMGSRDWVMTSQQGARRSIAEEMELYELMDRQSTALDGTSLGIDSGTEAMMI
jgi:hypothetical protein